MKKVIFAVIAMMAMTFVACGNQTVSTSDVNDTDSVATDTMVVDSMVVDTVVAE